MAQVLGIIDLYWRGQQLDIKPGATLELGGLRNAAVVLSRKVSRANHFMASKVTAKVAVSAGMVVTDVFNRNEGELQAICDTGQHFTWDIAFVTDALKLSGGDGGGDLDITWEAGDPKELTV